MYLGHSRNICNIHVSDFTTIAIYCLTTAPCAKKLVTLTTKIPPRSIHTIFHPEMGKFKAGIATATHNYSISKESGNRTRHPNNTELSKVPKVHGIDFSFQGCRI